VKLARAGLVALAFDTGCLRFGYDNAAHNPDVLDASQRDAGVTLDAAVADATPGHDAAISGGSGGNATYTGAGTGGMAGQAAGTSGAAAGTSGVAAGSSGGGGSSGQPNAGAAADSGTDIVLGDTGLQLSEVLGYYDASLLSGGDWGAMVLRRYGAEVIGAYQYNEGTVVGEITSEGIFVGWWSQLPSRAGLDAGEVEFRWYRSGSTIAFDGRWRWGSSGTWYENWDANLTNRTPPNELVAAFDNVENFHRHP